MVDELPPILQFEELLTSADKQRLQAALAAIPIIRRNIQKAKRAGIDTGDLEMQVDDAEKRLNRLLAEL